MIPHEIVLFYFVDCLYYGCLWLVCGWYFLVALRSLVLDIFLLLNLFFRLSLCIQIALGQRTREGISVILEEKVVVFLAIIDLSAHLLVQGQLLLDDFLLGLGEDGVVDDIEVIEFVELVHGDAAGGVEARLGGLVVQFLQVVVAEGAFAPRRQLSKRRHKLTDTRSFIIKAKCISVLEKVR